jgi:hypothetical protein
MNRHIFLSLTTIWLVFGSAYSMGQDVILTLREQVAGLPAQAPAIISRTLKAAGPNAALYAPQATAAVIQALGPKATTRQISEVVYAAVRLAPSVAVQIVRAAVAVAPNAAADIATAAVRAVPNPWKQVTYAGETPAPTDARSTPANQGNANREPDFKNAIEPTYEDDPGDPMTMAEAIALAAGGQQTAVDVALYGDPGVLFSTVGSPTGISGVGTVGNSNYLNEPKFPGDPPTGDPPTSTPPPPTSTPPPTPPSQDPVSP